MEDDLNVFKNGRQPQFFKNGRRGRQPQFFQKWKTISISFKGGRPQLFSNGRQPQHLSKCKMTSKFLLMEDNGCGTAPGNLVLLKKHLQRFVLQPYKKIGCRFCLYKFLIFKISTCLLTSGNFDLP
jgi:hypothetical protein